MATHGLGFDEVYDIIQKRYIDICRELDLDINMSSILSDLKEEIREGASQDYVASRGEYLNAIILSYYLDFEFIDAASFDSF